MNKLLLLIAIILFLTSCGPEVPRGIQYELYYEYYYPYGYRFAPMRIQRFRQIQPIRRYGRNK